MYYLGAHNTDMHHVKSRGAFGSNDIWNLCPLSRRYHTEIHKLGTSTFAKKYPQFEKWLLDNGWVYNEQLNKWRHE